MTDIEFELKKLRKGFYQRNYSVVIKVLIVLMFVNIIGIAKLFYDMKYMTESSYYASSKSGTVTQVFALSDPVYTHQELESWLSDSFSAIYNFNFVNYNEVFEKNLKYFTDNGFTRFKEVFHSPEFIDQIISNKILLSAFVDKSKIVFLKENLQGVYYTWQIKLPLSLHYQSTVGTTQRKINLLITLKRKSLRDIAIDNISILKEKN